MSPKGRILGVDYGTVRIGLAITDPDRLLSSPLSTYERKDKETDQKYFKQLVKEERVESIVVGLPVHIDGTQGQKAQEALKFGKWLGEITGLEVNYWDERYTSVEAEQFLQAAHLTKKRRKQRIDRVAAQILLQAYLEAGCPKGEIPKALDK